MKRWIGHGLALAMLLAATNATKADMYKKNETPSYTVELAAGDFEIRSYPPLLVAEVSVVGTRDGAIGQGFRILAGYIFGANESRAKVAMTTPVAQSPSEQISMTTPVAQIGSGTTWTVRFMMPSAYTIETLPKPKDGRIRFLTTPAERQVVLRFSGTAGTPVLSAKVDHLRAWAAARQLTLRAGPHFYFYDAPFTLPWNRRNEVAFTVE